MPRGAAAATRALRVKPRLACRVQQHTDARRFRCPCQYHVEHLGMYVPGHVGHACDVAAGLLALSIVDREPRIARVSIEPQEDIVAARSAPSSQRLEAVR